MKKVNGGYILQPRCFDDSEAAHMPPVTRELWFYLLRNVNHKDNGKFKRGGGFFSLSDIQTALSWMVGYRREVYSKPQLTKALRRLREGNMVETMKATRGLFISVCNYNEYQDPKTYEGNDEGTTKEQRRNSGGSTKNKNVKNERKKETTIKAFNPISLKPESVNEDDWEDLIIHRKKVKATETERAYKSVIAQLEIAQSCGFDSKACIDEMCNRSWRGFKAEWMDKKEKGGNNGRNGKGIGYIEPESGKDWAS